MDPSSSSSPEEQEAYREGGRPCCIQPLHHFFYEPWRKHSRLSMCCGHVVPQAGATVFINTGAGGMDEAGVVDIDPSSSSPEEQEANRGGRRPSYIKPFMATEPAHGGGSSPSASPSEGGRPSECQLEIFSTDLRKQSRTQDVAVASSLSKACLATSRNSGFVQRGVFFRSFSAMIEVFSSFPSPWPADARLPANNDPLWRRGSLEAPLALLSGPTAQRCDTVDARVPWLSFLVSKQRCACVFHRNAKQHKPFTR